jgi:prevent-host-death family protein
MIMNLREAKAQLSMLVQLAAEGEEIVITVRGRPTARMTAVTSPAGSASDARDWMHELAAAAETARCGEVRATPQKQWDDLRAERG